MENPNELTADTIEQVYKDAINDPTLLSSLDVDELLNTLENETNDYLENKTLDGITEEIYEGCLLYTSPSPRDRTRSRMPSSA